MLIEFLKRLIKKTPLYNPLRIRIAKGRMSEELAEWERTGKVGPAPHLIKQRALRDYGERHGLRIMVETGTFQGDMVDAMKNHFDTIYSIELSDELFKLAKKRFLGERKIELINGDSGVEIAQLMGRIDQPTLFWLDGHYSGGVTARADKDTPILEELDHILDSKCDGHVIIVDDARCFGSDPGYPSIQELSDFVISRKPDAEIEIKDDSIRISSI